MWDDQYKKRYKNGVALAVAGFTSTWEIGRDLYCDHVIDSPQQIAVMRSVPMHCHAEFEVLCILKGGARFTVDGNSFTANAGDLVIVNPYQVHSMEAIPEIEEYSHTCICFSHALLEPAGEICRTEPQYRITTHISDSPVAEVLQKHILATIDAYLGEKNGWEYEVRGQMCLWFSRLIAEGQVQYDVAYAQVQNGFAVEVIRYIDAHLAGELSVREIAAVFSYTDAYFCRIFKKHFGCTFTQFCHNRRIYAAQRMFAAGQTNILEAAEAVGIPNCSYFAKLFRRTLGILPSEYIRMLR